MTTPHPYMPPGTAPIAPPPVAVGGPNPVLRGAVRLLLVMFTARWLYDVAWALVDVIAPPPPPSEAGIDRLMLLSGVRLGVSLAVTVGQLVALARLASDEAMRGSARAAIAARLVLWVFVGVQIAIPFIFELNSYIPHVIVSAVEGVVWFGFLGLILATAQRAGRTMAATVPKALLLLAWILLVGWMIVGLADDVVRLQQYISTDFGSTAPEASPRDILRPVYEVLYHARMLSLIAVLAAVLLRSGKR